MAHGLIVARGILQDLLEKKDSVVEIPFTRWDLDMCPSRSLTMFLGSPVKLCCILTFFEAGPVTPADPFPHRNVSICVCVCTPPFRGGACHVPTRSKARHVEQARCYDWPHSFLGVYVLVDLKTLHVLNMLPSPRIGKLDPREFC